MLVPPTVESITPDGPGRHLWFNAHGHIPCSVGEIAPGIDVRGDGGYVLVPPSRHPNGKDYVWSVDSAATFADASEWLHKLIGSGANGNGKIRKTALDWHKMLSRPIEDGARNKTLTAIAGKLIHHGHELHFTLDMLACVNAVRCNPPLDAEVVETIVTSVTKTHLKRLGVLS